MKDIWCKHYNSLVGPGSVRNITCKAGVVYTSLFSDPTASLVQQLREGLPCFDIRHKTRCAKAEYPTPEEVAEHERQIREMFLERFNKIKAGICPDCGQPMTK